MPRKLNRKFLQKLTIIAASLGLIGVGLVYLSNRPDRLEVDFLDVGQGDAILIRTPYGQTILIDGGPDNKVVRRLGERLPYYKRKIDFILVSHYHDDHVVGLAQIAKRYKIGQLIYATGLQSSPAIQELAKYIVSPGNEPSFAPSLAIDKQADLFLGPNCNLSLLNPVSLGIKNDGNNSLVARLVCLGQSFLFTGDNSATVEKALLKSGWPLKSLVLKAAHHGSNSANSANFLRAVAPRLLMISVGADNKFGHPHPKVLERARAFNISVKRTDQAGNWLIFDSVQPVN